MILEAIDIMLRVFQTQTYGKIFGFQKYRMPMQHAVHIPCGMPGSQNNVFRLIHLAGNRHPMHPTPIKQEAVHPLPEMNFSPAALDGFPDIHNHTGQFISPDMGMGIHQDTCIGAMVHQYFHRPPHIPPFFRTGKQLAVGKRSGTAFSETEIGILIHASRPI